MKGFLTVLIVALAAMVILPSASYSFNNLIGIEIMGGSGEFDNGSTEADIETGQFGTSYTRYFTALETTGSPYGMREYLQHPSYLAVGLESQAMDITVNGVPMSMELTEATFTIDGMYYFKGGTGIGATLESVSGEEESKIGGVTVDKDEITEAALTLSIDHFITDTTSIGASLTSKASESKDSSSGATIEYDEATLMFGASSLINDFFWIAGSQGGRSRQYDQGPEFDTSEFELVVGAFPMQRLGLFLGVDVETLEGNSYESTGTTTRLTLDYSISEKVNVQGSLYSMKEEVTDAGSDEDMEMTWLQLAVGVLF